MPIPMIASGIKRVNQKSGELAFKSRPIQACCRVHRFSPLSLPVTELGSLLKV